MNEFNDIFLFSLKMNNYNYNLDFLSKNKEKYISIKVYHQLGNYLGISELI
jgi:hypothetical protein